MPDTELWRLYGVNRVSSANTGCGGRHPSFTPLIPGGHS
jgi:hypothetical protein